MVSRFRIFAYRTIENNNLKLSKCQNLLLPFLNWRKCISPVALLPKMQCDVCNAASKDVQNWQHCWQKPAIFLTITAGCRPSSKCLYSRIWVTHTPIKLLKRHKKTAFHTVICRFFCTYISIISFIVLKRLLINYETIY